MEEQSGISTERLESVTSLLERTLHRLEQQAGEITKLSGEVARISATVEASQDLAQESGLVERLAAAEKQLAELKAGTPEVMASIRRTVPAMTSELLAKHGIGDGPVEVRALDAALTGLSLEQRIAVKSQLLRAGAIA